MLHWSEKLANELMQEFPGLDTYTFATGISPSGKVHIGNFRDVVTSDLVYRTMLAKGQKARFIFSWDDFDRFRKVPVDLLESYSQYIGLPLTEVPDPKGEYPSYARRHEIEFENALRTLGINPLFKYQTREYRSGRYSEMIGLALQKRKEIAKIIAGYKTQGMTEDEINNYYPLNVYSRFSGKDNTKVTSFNGDSKVEYVCLDCGKRDTIDITTDHVVKLPWRVDWPMRWKFEGVNFEPGGTDHASPGGSYEVGSIISQKIFGNKAPHFQGYSFIGIRGLKGKMSSSKGVLVTPEQLLDIYEPAMIRWLFLKYDPSSSFDFSFDSEVFRQYSEFDEFVKNAGEGDIHLLKLMDPSGQGNFSRNPIPFRKLTGYGQSVSFKQNKLEDLLTQTKESFDLSSIKIRLSRAKSWLETYNPQDVRVLRTNVNTEYMDTLSFEEKEQLRRLVTSLDSERSVEEWEILLYAIPKKPGLVEKELKIAQRRFFKNIYIALFGNEIGPRLPTYIWAENKTKIKELLQPQ